MEIKTTLFLKYYEKMEEHNVNLYRLHIALSGLTLTDIKQEIANIILEDKLAKRSLGYGLQDIINELRFNLLNCSQNQYKPYFVYLNSYIEEIGYLVDFQVGFIKQICDIDKYPEEIFLYKAVRNQIKTVEDCKGFYVNWFLVFKEMRDTLKETMISEFKYYTDINEGETQSQNNLNNHIKLKWRGQQNQLYSIMRQLKNEYEITDSSYDDIADFIKQNFTGFENIKISTIQKELKKKAPLPHKKRIPINLNKNELN